MTGRGGAGWGEGGRLCVDGMFQILDCVSLRQPIYNYEDFLFDTYCSRLSGFKNFSVGVRACVRVGVRVHASLCVPACVRMCVGGCGGGRCYSIWVSSRTMMFHVGTDTIDFEGNTFSAVILSCLKTDNDFVFISRLSSSFFVRFDVSISGGHRP